MLLGGGTVSTTVCTAGGTGVVVLGGAVLVDDGTVEVADAPEADRLASAIAVVRPNAADAARPPAMIRAPLAGCGRRGRDAFAMRGRVVGGAGGSSGS